MPRCRLVLLSLIALAALALSGCATPVACPAVGWINTLTVQVEGGSAKATEVQLCTSDGCAPGPDVDPSSSLGTIFVAGKDGRTWQFSTGMTRVEQVTVRALAADGTVLSDTDVAPEWLRVGGSEQCGGPAQATVTVRL